MQNTSAYEIQAQILTAKNDMLLLYIFKQLGIKLQQCTLQLVTWVESIYTMMTQSRLSPPFKLYQPAQSLHNQYIKIRTCSIIFQLKKLQFNSSQKIQQLKLSFIKNGEITQFNNKTSAQQSEPANSSPSYQQRLRLIHLKIHKISTKLTKIRIRRYYSLILVFILLIASSPSIKATAPSTCNSFPKIFGGSSGHSQLYQIDVFNDYLAMAGDTSANSLTGSYNRIPYIALQSISIGGFIFWAKAFSSKAWQSMSGVQFSTDGALLIAHSQPSSCFIVVINVSSGNILSARSYSAGGHQNYNYRVKSMLVSSGASPMAYVLSNYKTSSSSSCTGQHLFKFNPLTYSSALVWMKQTNGNYDCGHLGLEFGRSESLVYAFSWSNGLSTVSLLDTNGNSFWQYSTPDGDSSKSNSIKYKLIGTTTDMIIATSGSNYINYNRIFSSSTSPYSVDTALSKTYRDPASSSSRQLYALHIDDQDNAVSLIYDSSNQQTDLATINFQAPSITYQSAFPRIYDMATAFITSPTVYYAGGHDLKFYIDQTTTSYQSLNTFQSIVYSSNMATTSCYSMAPIVTPAPITMTILTTMSSIPSTIYGASSVTFVEDTQAKTTVDIIQSKITNINSWCSPNPLGPFTVNTVTQATSTFTILRSSSDKQLPITPFSATLNCGSYANTWAYTGVDNSDGHALVAGTDFMSVDSTSGAIIVQQSKPVGTYKVKVIGTLPDLATTHSENFTIKIIAIDPPYFINEKPQNQEVRINTELLYTLPPIKDPEDFQVIITFKPEEAKSFVSIQEKTVKFAPKYLFQVGTTQITLFLTNQLSSSNSSFNVTVYQPPEFTEKLQKQDIAILSYSKYTLPVNKDSKLSVHHPSSPGLPHFVKFEYPDYFFHPENPSDIGNFIIDGELLNDYTKIQFQLKVNVTNQAPYLQDGKISDLKVAIKSDYTLNFSEGVDREGQKIKYEGNERYKQVLPSFITFSPETRQFKIKPTKLDTLKDYHIELALIDNFNARTIYPFVVTIYDPLKQFQSFANNTKINQQPIAKQYLSAKIQQINPYGLIIIKFFETLDSPLFINNASLKFNSTNIDIRLKPFQDQNKSITQWEAINLTTTQLTIQVNFSDPSLISPKISQEDKIEIKFRDGELFRSTNGQKCLPDDYVLMSGIPRQIVLTKQIASISEMISSGSKAMTYFVIGNVALQLLMSFSMHLLWGMMNNLQLMGKMLKFNVNVPSNAYIFFKYIDEFLSMKAKFIEDYLEKFNQLIMKTTTTSAESEKDSNSSIIKNLGTIILGSVALVLAMILTAILIKFSRIPLIMKITAALKNKLFFNSILRTGVQSYLQFSIVAFSSLESKKDNATLAIGISFLCLTVFFLFFVHIFLRKNLVSLSDPNFQQRFNSLYLNIETGIPHSYLLTTIFLVRRFILGIVLSYGENQAAQFFYMNFTSFLIIIFLVKVKPLVTNYLNIIEIFNEVTLYASTGLIWGMTDYQEDRPNGLTSEQINAAYNSKQNKIGWAYISLASTTIVLTVGGIIINCLILIRTKLKEKCQNNNKAVKGPIVQQSPTRSQDYALQKQDDSTMIQNKSIVSEVNQKHQIDLEVIQEESSQQIEEEQEDYKMDDSYLDDQPYRLDSFPMSQSFSNQIEVPPQPVPQQKRQPLLRDAFVITEEEQSIYHEMSQFTKMGQWVGNKTFERKLINTKDEKQYLQQMNKHNQQLNHQR